MRSESRPGRVGGQPTNVPFWGVLGRVSCGKVAIARANLWIAEALGQTVQCVWNVIVTAAIAAMETGRRRIAAAMGGGAITES
jgi:hypothetical protein